MRLTFVFGIAAREVLSTLRDRRAIVSNLLVPLLLLPLMMLGLPIALGSLFSREQVAETPAAVRGMERLPEGLLEALEASGVAAFPHEDPEEAVRSGEAVVGLGVPEEFGARLSAGERVELELFGKRSNLRSEVGASKATAAVDAYSRQLVAARLAEAGLDPALLEPLGVSQVDVSSEAERSGGQMSWIIPFFIAMWTLVGGQMTAIDATAGEKERGTLEALLVSPVRRVEVVVGKFLATLTFGLSAAAMAILGYVLGGSVLDRLVGSRLDGEAAEAVAALGGSLHVTPASVAFLLVSTVLLAATIAALLLGVALFARSFKEAQSYVAPLSFLLVLPAVMLQFRDLLDLGLGIYVVPVVNALLLMDDAVTGSATVGAAAVTWVSLLAVTAALLAFALGNFRRESVIFRT